MNKREIIIDKLVESGWKPNIDYLNDEYASWYWIVEKSTDNYGRFCTTTNNGSKEYSEYNYLISPHKKYAITIKECVITVHEAKKKYTKILTFDIEDVDIKVNGLKCGVLMLLFND